MNALTQDTQLSRAEDRLPLPAGAKRLLGLPHYVHFSSAGGYITSCYEAPLNRVLFGFWVPEVTCEGRITGYRVATDADLRALSSDRLRELREQGETMARKYQALLDVDAYLDRGTYMDSADPATLGKLRRGDERAFDAFRALGETTVGAAA